MAAAEEAAARLAARKPIPTPTPAYLPKAGSPLAVDRDTYAAIQQAPRKLIEEFVLPIRSGRAWKAPAGSIVRISTPEGPQVGEYHLRLPSLFLTSTRRPQRVESPQSKRTVLGIPNQAVICFPRLDI